MGFDAIPDRANFVRKQALPPLLYANSRAQLAQAESAKVELLTISQNRGYKNENEADTGRGCVIY